MEDESEIIIEGLSTLGLIKTIVSKGTVLPNKNRSNLDSITTNDLEERLKEVVKRDGYLNLSLVENIDILRDHLQCLYEGRERNSPFPPSLDPILKSYRAPDLVLLGHKLRLYQQRGVKDAIMAIVLSDIANTSLDLSEIVWDNKFRDRLYEIALNSLNRKPRGYFSKSDRRMVDEINQKLNPESRRYDVKKTASSY